MNKILIILSLVLLASCGPSQEDREVAAITCAIMDDIDGAVRVREMNDAREKIGGEPFLRGDDAIKEAFDWGLCQKLVLNENYDNSLQPLKEAKRERERIAAEKQKIADSKPRVKEEFHLNGKLLSRTTYQSKSDEADGHGFFESYYENGELDDTGNYKYGKRDGTWSSHNSYGQLAVKANYTNGNVDGVYYQYKYGQSDPYNFYCFRHGSPVERSDCDCKPVGVDKWLC